MTTADTGLFGLSPWEALQQQQKAEQDRQTAIQSQGNNFAQMSAAQRGAQGMYAAGGQLAGMLNPQPTLSPAVLQSVQQQQIMGAEGTDLSTSEGTMAVANKFRQAGDLNTAMKLTLRANELKKQESLEALQAAQAKQAEARASREEARANELERSDGLKNLPPAVQGILKLAGMKPTDPGYNNLKKWVDMNSTPADAKDAAGVAEYKFATSPAGGGFKGDYTSWLKSKAQATHITVGGAAGSQKPKGLSAPASLKWDLDNGFIDQATYDQAVAGTAGGKAATASAAAQKNALGALKAAGYDPATKEDNVEKLILSSTSGGTESAGADLAGFFGVSTSGAKAIARLKTLESSITMGAMGGKLGAGISNSDREFIVQQFGQIANPKLPADTRVQAWRQARDRMIGIGLIPESGSAPEASPTPAPSKPSKPVKWGDLK